MAARITVSLNAEGEFETWLNPEGRDVLVKELQELSETNDHFHLGPRPIAVTAPRPDAPKRGA